MTTVAEVAEAIVLDASEGITQLAVVTVGVDLILDLAVTGQLVADAGFAIDLQTQEALIGSDAVVIAAVVHALYAAADVQLGTVLVVDGGSLGTTCQQQAGDGHRQCCLFHCSLSSGVDTIRPVARSFYESVHFRWPRVDLQTLTGTEANDDSLTKTGSER
ncbi:hypothetical protein D3C72_1105240 [compost metagenome]